VRRTLDCMWSESEGAARTLEELEKGNEDLYRFEKMLEAQQNISNARTKLLSSLESVSEWFQEKRWRVVSLIL